MLKAWANHAIGQMAYFLKFFMYARWHRPPSASPSRGISCWWARRAPVTPKCAQRASARTARKGPTLEWGPGAFRWATGKDKPPLGSPKAAAVGMASPSFWARYRRLPADVRELADNNPELLKVDPVIHLSASRRSANTIGSSWRVQHRALAVESPERLVWF